MKRTIDELRAALKSSVVNFTFTKLNGEVRKARGTTQSNLIPSSFRSASAKKAPSNKVITYFDLDANGFRNVSVDADVNF
jgi:hypothetical protein